MTTEKPTTQTPAPTTPAQPTPAKEIGGRKGPDPTSYGYWENGGKCVDF
ncbi:MAG: DUF1674 domain-containing protein [Alphaproteobacteria bacterium]|nr:DUF1674 domain-containing protein [Alphaproteobacteria bacterium]